MAKEIKVIIKELRKYPDNMFVYILAVKGKASCLVIIKSDGIVVNNILLGNTPELGLPI